MFSGPAAPAHPQTATKRIMLYRVGGALEFPFAGVYKEVRDLATRP